MFLGDVADKRRWVSEIYLQSLGTLAGLATGQVLDDRASPRTPPTTCLGSNAFGVSIRSQLPNFQLPTAKRSLEGC